MAEYLKRAVDRAHDVPPQLQRLFKLIRTLDEQAAALQASAEDKCRAAVKAGGGAKKQRTKADAALRDEINADVQKILSLSEEKVRARFGVCGAGPEESVVVVCSGGDGCAASRALPCCRVRRELLAAQKKTKDSLTQCTPHDPNPNHNPIMCNRCASPRRSTTSLTRTSASSTPTCARSTASCSATARASASRCACRVMGCGVCCCCV